jgi:endonuclease V-like protein UPF0215 family
MKQPKKQIRILGIDDSYFEKGQSEPVLVVGVICRGGEYMDKLISTYIQPDGIDATQKIIEMINNTSSKDQIQIIMLDGIALGGFNVININSIYQNTKIPVIVIIRRLPDLKRIEQALTNILDGEKKLKVIKSAGQIYEYPVEHRDLKKPGKIYFQIAGISEDKAKEILKLSTVHGLVPEPIRLAHIIGQGVVLGESKGRA